MCLYPSIKAPRFIFGSKFNEQSVLSPLISATKRCSFFSRWYRRVPLGALSRPTIAVEDRGRVRVVTLDNPQKRNALDYQSLRDLEEACAGAARDGARCLVFRGSGDKAFCSGFDIEAIPTGPQEGDRPDLAVERTMEAFRTSNRASVSSVQEASEQVEALAQRAEEVGRGMGRFHTEGS